MTRGAEIADFGLMLFHGGSDLSSFDEVATAVSQALPSGWRRDDDGHEIGRFELAKDNLAIYVGSRSVEVRDSSGAWPARTEFVDLVFGLLEVFRRKSLVVRSRMWSVECKLKETWPSEGVGKLFNVPAVDQVLGGSREPRWQVTDLSIDFVSDALPGSFYSIDIDIDYSETPPPDTTVEVFATFRDQLPATEGLLTEGAAVTGDVQQILSRLAG